MDEEQVEQIVRLVIHQLENVAEEPLNYGGIPDATQKLADAGLCLWCEEPLGKKKPRRGLHESCYRQLLRDLAKRGRSIGWAVANGAALPADKPGPKTKTATRLDEIVQRSQIESEEYARRRGAMKKKADPYSQTPGQSNTDPKPRKNHG